MQPMARLIGIGYLLVCLASIAATAFIGPLGYAPLPLGIGPAQEPVVVTIWYGTEKREWLEESARRFAATNPRVGSRPVEIVLRGVGSRAIPLRTATEDFGSDGAPTVISPASSIWVEVLKTEWAGRNVGAAPIVLEGPDAPQPLALTPLVLVIWDESAKLLWDDASQMDWQSIHDALADQEGWVGVAKKRGFAPGSPEYQSAEQRGYVKFGHTSPLTSNSGAQALTLLAYGYHNKVRDLQVSDITNPEFQQWLFNIENAVLEFGDSTGTFMTNMVQFGPSKYDIVAVYENVALENIATARNRWGQDIRIYYPPATVFSDHPYAILDAPWVTDDQQQGGRLFRDFLLTRPIQELALRGIDPAQPYGFRPADPNVPIVDNDANNPFNRFRDYGVRVDVPQVVETPSGDVVNTLLEFWRRRINK